MCMCCHAASLGNGEEKILTHTSTHTHTHQNTFVHVEIHTHIAHTGTFTRCMHILCVHTEYSVPPSPSSLQHTHITQHLLHAVSGFCYYQFYCFGMFTLPSAPSDISLLSNIFNKTVSISQQICVTTSPLRQFIASAAPWFKYQKETWLALGKQAPI